jgi:hypothetical protein
MAASAAAGESGRVSDLDWTLARLIGWSITLEELAQRMRCSQCGKKAAETVAAARPRPRGAPKNQHKAELGDPA